MKYMEITLGKPYEEWRVELVVQRMGDLGFDAFDASGEQLRAYIQQERYEEEALKSLLAEAGYPPEIEVKELEDKDWNREWELNYYKPAVIVEGELAVRASFHEPVGGVAHEIIIDPKMAFGTGNHATTQGMLTLMSQIRWDGLSVIDMGCGSGILGIYAMKKGAASCTSIDVDEWSVVNARENAAANGVELDVLQGGVEALRQVPRADIFLANINRNVILEDLPRYISRLHPSGLMFLSGFLDEDLPQIMSAVTAHGFTMAGHIEMPRGWIATRVANHMP